MKLITEEDVFTMFCDIGIHSQVTPSEVREIAKALNKLLEEKGQMGYTRLGVDVNEVYVCGVVGGKTQFDTHKAFVILEPIEEEKPDCVLDHDTIVRIQQISRDNIENSFEKVAFGSACFMEYTQCPLCGKELNK